MKVVCSIERPSLARSRKAWSVDFEVKYQYGMASMAGL